MRALILLLFIAIYLSSCDPCNNLDCAVNNFYGQFRIVSASTGGDLVFGPNSIYNKNQIRFYSMQGKDTSFFEYQTIKFSGAGYDSILQVYFYPKTDTAYMQLSNGDIDTLQIFYHTFSTRCCGSITEISNFRYNNSTDIPGNKDTQELKK